MVKNRYKIMWWCSCCCAVLFFLSGCASSPVWYKKGHNQVDFNLDNMECMRIAEEVGRQATITGEKINQKVFTVSYNNCLFSRGWSQTPLGTSQKNIQAVNMAKINGNIITIFDKQLTLPLQFEIINNQINGFEDVKMQTLFFQSKSNLFLNITIQETLSRKFDPIDYPVNEPFFLFERGESAKGNDIVNWAVFFGEFNGQWVTGIGAYYPVSKNKRVSMVMTKTINSPVEKPPSGLRLTKNQKLEVEYFSDQWLKPVKLCFGDGS
ncbi:hypothetical protein KAJ27_17815 [bacterium]|nr:hypothetical protein [bacterium]